MSDHHTEAAGMNEHDRLGHAVGDARKRLLELPPNHDEQHAHLHEWPDEDEGE